MGARGAIAASYGLAGVLTALWGAALPATDARLDLGHGRIGVVLMAMAAGALVAMPIAGRLAERWTGRRLLRLAGPASALAMLGPAVAPTPQLLVASAVLLGVGFGALNVALSVQAVAMERAAGRPLMATMHGTWTLGAVAGGVAVTSGLHAGLDVRLLMTSGSVAVALAAVALRQPRPPRPAAGAGPEPATTPPRPVLLIMLGLIGAAAFITEGAATDWAGVHATRVLGADPATASLVYTIFFGAMTAIRFVSDAVRARLGAATTIRLAGCIATAGYVLVQVSGVVHVAVSTKIGFAIAGWALAGAGMAAVWPIVISALGASGAPARRLSAVTTLAYGGGLGGPALIGYLASAATLPAALLVPAALALLVATIAPATVRAIQGVKALPEAILGRPSGGCSRAMVPR
jgi:MFS family permease